MNLLERDLEQSRIEGACELIAWGSTVWTGSSFSFIDVLLCNRMQVLLISLLLLIWARSAAPSTSITVFRALNYYFIQPSQKIDVNKEQFFIGCVKYLKSNKSVRVCWRRVSSSLRAPGQRNHKSECMKTDLTKKIIRKVFKRTNFDTGLKSMRAVKVFIFFLLSGLIVGHRNQMVLKPAQLMFIKAVSRNSESVTLVDEVPRNCGKLALHDRWMQT